MLLRSRTWRIGLWLGVAAALFGCPALAADTGNGSKNFNVPNSVPNYFSNEAGPMVGGAAESRRGALYSGQAPAAQPPRQTTAMTAAAPQPRPRQHLAMAEPRGRLIRGRRAAPGVTHRVAAHGRAPQRVVSRGGSHVTHVASRTTHIAANRATHTATRTAAHTASKATRAVNPRHHARG